MIHASAIVSAPASALYVQPRRGRPPELKRSNVVRVDGTGAALDGRTTAEELLWRGVLLRLLIDALGLDALSNCEGARQRNMRQARAWLSTPSGDLDAVLTWCGIDGGWWRDRIGRLKELWRDIDAGAVDPRRLTSAQLLPGVDSSQFGGVVISQSAGAKTPRRN